MGRPTPLTIALTPQEEMQLRQLLRKTSAPVGVVRRARIVLARARGDTITAIAHQQGIARQHVCKWLRRWLAHGKEGLTDARRTRYTKRQSTPVADPRQPPLFPGETV
jgi:Helix-turn-helix domain